jgi:hypothetical protein
MLRSMGEKEGRGGGRFEDVGRENIKDRKIKKESKKRGEVNEKLVCLKTCHFYFYF